MKALRFVLLLGGILAISSCSSRNEVHTYWVNSYKAPCSGVGEMTCLLIQKGDKITPGAWTTFYANIEGFDYVPGYIYQLKVEEEQLTTEDVPADASSIKYSLVELESKESDLKLRLNDVWLLSKLLGKTINAAEEGEGRKDALMEIQIADRSITGTDGCNNFHGSITSVSNTELTFGPIAGTRRMCMDMTVADNFNKAIIKVQNYKIENNQLFLYCEEGNELMVFKKID